MGTEARKFFQESYPDILERLGDEGIKEYTQNPAGLLGCVRLDKYHRIGKQMPVVLAGDSCHAVVPFFGQGVQCGFEDVFVLGQQLGKYKHEGNLDNALKEYSRLRVRSCHALREMALDNMAEMGDRVGQERFRLLKQVESKIERAIPHKYRSRYALVSYSYNDYADVNEVGEVQRAFLEEIAKDITSPDEVDMRKAETLIAEMIAPEFQRRGMSLDLGPSA